MNILDGYFDRHILDDIFCVQGVIKLINQKKLSTSLLLMWDDEIES